jgi:hypoxanthine phosphoribosyltransferase
MNLSELTADLNILISESQIQQACEQIGNQITVDYANRKNPLTIIGTLKGSALFLADLIRHIDLPVRMDFIELSSYGNSMHSSGSVKINKDIKTAIEGHDVILIEDIIDTGITFNFLFQFISSRNPASVEMACLLRKKDKANTMKQVRYCGFDIEDHFVVGYGLDFRGLFRNLKEIAVLDDHTKNRCLHI